MTQATSIAARYRDAPRVIEPDTDGQWKVDGVTVTLRDDGKLEIASAYARHPEMRLDVYDGELRIPLEDLVPSVLERLDIGELARMICVDQEARREILDSLARRYNDHSIEDSDRRYWIAKVKQAVHDARLDALTTTMATIERAVAQMGYDAMRDVAYDNVLRHELERAGVDAETALAAKQRYPARQRDLVDFGRFIHTMGLTDGVWAQARDYWRERVEALFRNVEVPEPIAEESL